MEEIVEHRLRVNRSLRRELEEKLGIGAGRIASAAVIYDERYDNAVRGLHLILKGRRGRKPLPRVTDILGKTMYIDIAFSNRISLIPSISSYLFTVETGNNYAQVAQGYEHRYSRNRY